MPYALALMLTDGFSMMDRPAGLYQSAEASSATAVKAPPSTEARSPTRKLRWLKKSARAGDASTARASPNVRKVLMAAAFWHGPARPARGFLHAAVRSGYHAGMRSRPQVNRVAEILKKAGLVDELQLRSAMARLEQWGGRLTGVLADMGMVDGEQVAETLAKALKLPTAHLGMVPKDGGALARIDATYCTEHGIFPVSLKDRVFTLAMADPTEIDVIDHVAAKAGARVSVVVASEAEISAAIARHYYGQATRKGDNLARRAFTSEVPAMGGLELDASSPPPPSSKTEGPPVLRRTPSANTMLDEMFDEAAEKATEGGFTEAELQRLESARVNQEKASAILRALEALLAEKGYR
ncbi:MAG: hypothetical protein AB1938_06345 [Myxococcota bacterium]